MISSPVAGPSSIALRNWKRGSSSAAAALGEARQKDHGELFRHGATPWSLLASPLAKV